MRFAVLSRPPGWLALSGLACVLLLGWVCARSSPQQALLSWLFAFVFFTGLSVGSLALLMMHALTGGTWGERIRPQVRAAAGTLPLQALFAIPLLWGVHALYPWAYHDAAAHDARLRAQSWFLDTPFFVARTIVYFALWLALLAAVRRLLADPARTAALTRVAAGGLIIYALSSLLASTDWVMSLMPRWHSSTFGLMVATGWMLAAAALAILRAATATDATAVHTPAVLHDLGSLLLMFVLAWAYLAFMQYLTVWIADQPAEIAWYLPRTRSSWRALAWFLLAFHFALPFAVLLSRNAKRHRAWLAVIAGMLLIGNLADALWLTAPGLRLRGFALHWTDLLAVAGMGTLWWSAYLHGLGPRARELPGESVPLETAHG